MDDMTAGQVILTLLVLVVVGFLYSKRSKVKSLLGGGGWNDASDVKKRRH